MILDSGKPASHINTTDDQQPLYARQTQLATLVQSMVERSTTQEAAATKVKIIIYVFYSQQQDNDNNNKINDYNY